jgi:hypothetical protein
MSSGEGKSKTAKSEWSLPQPYVLRFSTLTSLNSRLCLRRTDCALSCQHTVLLELAPDGSNAWEWICLTRGIPNKKPSRTRGCTLKVPLVLSTFKYDVRLRQVRTSVLVLKSSVMRRRKHLQRLYSRSCAKKKRSPCPKRP